MHYPAARRRRFIRIMFAILPLSGCSALPGFGLPGGGEPLTGLATMTVRIGDDDFLAELPRSASEQMTGLMYRQPEDFSVDQAMLFTFSPPIVVSVINSNVLFDIDVAFVRQDRSIVSIIQLQAGDPFPHWSPEPVAHFLEVRAGQFAQRDIGPGDLLEFVIGEE